MDSIAYFNSVTSPLKANEGLCHLTNVIFSVVHDIVALKLSYISPKDTKQAGKKNLAEKMPCSVHESGVFKVVEVDNAKKMGLGDKHGTNTMVVDRDMKEAEVGANGIELSANADVIDANVVGYEMGNVVTENEERNEFETRDKSFQLSTQTYDQIKTVIKEDLVPIDLVGDYSSST